MVVIDIIGRSCFLIGAAIGLAINRMMGLAIDRVILTEMDIIVGFSELSLW